MHPTDQQPEWIPPPTLDPTQQPRRNTAHSPTPVAKLGPTQTLVWP
jgi:hypothetical protein